MNACNDCYPPRKDDLYRVMGICPKCWAKMDIGERLRAMKADIAQCYYDEGVDWEYCAARIWEGWAPTE